jgi:L-threonylcarbamoyladenylate synthase
MTTSLVTEHLSYTDQGIDRGGQILREGGLVAFPTETVYGLGADGTCETSVERLYNAKGRPALNPLIAHIAHREAANIQGIFTKIAATLAEAFWPGPLTLVVPRAPSATLVHRATAGLDTVALRIPQSELIRRMLAATHRPIVAPSANRSGTPSATLASHVFKDLDGQINAIIDGDSTAGGLESTILDCTQEGAVYCLRPGAISREKMENTLGIHIPMRGIQPTVCAPGMLSSHYAPRAQIRLNASEFFPGEAALLFGDSSQSLGLGHVHAIRHLSYTGCFTEAATNLFAHLRELDDLLTPCAMQDHHDLTIAVSPIPTTGLGEAINDRLLRASAPRPP